LQAALPYLEVVVSRQLRESAEVRYGSAKFAVYHSAVLEWNLTSVKPVKAIKKGTPPFLSTLLFFDHTGPPPHDLRCACGALLDQNLGCKYGVNRKKGMWQCFACSAGICVYTDCEAPGHFNHPSGGKSCIKHHCGWCSTPGCEKFASTHLDLDGDGFLCNNCRRGICVIDGCNSVANVGTAGNYKCRRHGNPKCVVSQCFNIAFVLNVDGDLSCQKHIFGNCSVAHCESYAKADHGLCAIHRDKGTDYVANVTANSGPGWTYFFDIFDAFGNHLYGVHGCSHESNIDARVKQYAPLLAKKGWVMSEPEIFYQADIKVAKEQDHKIFKTVAGDGIQDIDGLKHEAYFGVTAEQLIAAFDFDFNNAEL